MVIHLAFADLFVE